MPTSDLRQAYLDVLLEQVRSCRFASPTMMERLERTIGDRENAEAYVRTLIATMSEERFPSPQLLDRVAGLLDLLERAG
jgi:hypothetical protein